MNEALANRIKQAADHYGYEGIIEPGMIQLIEEEGFVAGKYDDDVGVETQGVGQTAENMGENFFTETYPKYVARSASRVQGYGELPEDLQSAILSGVYRGDIPKDSNTARLLSEGNFGAASEEYLNHAEYKRRKKENPKDGVVARMDRNAAVMKKYAK
jgi:GH24 family phage-related lysozyme (muramidase)